MNKSPDPDRGRLVFRAWVMAWDVIAFLMLLLGGFDHVLQVMFGPGSTRPPLVIVGSCWLTVLLAGYGTGTLAVWTLRRIPVVGTAIGAPIRNPRLREWVARWEPAREQKLILALGIPLLALLGLSEMVIRKSRVPIGPDHAAGTLTWLLVVAAAVVIALVVASRLVRRSDTEHQ